MSTYIPAGVKHYRAEIDEPCDETCCECGSCDWKGSYVQLKPIGDCSLTPGDQSPAGRCPIEDCESLAYIVTKKTILADASQELFNALLDLEHFISRTTYKDLLVRLKKDIAEVSR